MNTPKDQVPTELWNKWIKGDLHGKLLGEFSMVDVYGHPGAMGEIYWINDPNNVGIRYPDNSRMVASKGILQWRDVGIREAFGREVRAFYKATGTYPKLRILNQPKIRIKGEQQPKHVHSEKSGQAVAAPPKLRIGFKKKIRISLK